MDPIQLSESSLRIIALLGLLCQAAAIGLAIWFCVRAERHLGRTHALLATLAARTDVSLKVLEGSQRALQVSAEGLIEETYDRKGRLSWGAGRRRTPQNAYQDV